MFHKYIQYKGVRYNIPCDNRILFHFDIPFQIRTEGMFCLWFAQPTSENADLAFGAMNANLGVLVALCIP
jgi:hypothetical protein